MTPAQERASAKWRANNPELVQLSKRNQRAKRRALMNDLKNAPCKDCGGRYPPCAMDFDHVPERGEKTVDVGYAAVSGLSLQTLLNEIAKCDLICSNCHRIRTYNRGYK